MAERSIDRCQSYEYSWPKYMLNECKGRSLHFEAHRQEQGLCSGPVWCLKLIEFRYSQEKMLNNLYPIYSIV